MTTQRRVLVHPAADGWLLGGVGVVAWVVVRAAGTGPATLVSGGLEWFLVSLAAVHFGISYHLAYADGRRSVREHPVALALVPLLLVATAAVAVLLVPMSHGRPSRALLSNLILVVFTLTGWHYIKQAFGVAMLSAKSRSASVSKNEAQILRYGLYPMWAYQALGIYQRGGSTSFRGVVFSTSVVGTGVRHAVWLAGLAGVVAALVVVVRIGRRLGGFPPAGVWATYAAGSLWLLAPPSFLSAGLVLSAVHSTQYLAVAHRADVDRAVERGEREIAMWWICVFGGAAVAGLMFTTFVPGFLDHHAVVGTVPGLYGTLLFVALNLHHYAIDAVIWRSSGEHVARIVRGPARAGHEGGDAPRRPVEGKPDPDRASRLLPVGVDEPDPGRFDVAGEPHAVG